MNKKNKSGYKLPVREGKETSSVLHDKKPPAKNKYPRSTVKDIQEKNQPEFIEPSPERKEKS